VEDPADRERLWHNRDSLALKLAKVRQERWINVVVSDIGVPSSQVPGVLEQLYVLTKQDGMPKGISVYGHIGDGNLHVTTTADRATERGRAITNNFTTAVLDIVKVAGGTLTAEHGPGFVKGMYVEDMVGPVGMGVLRAIKHAIDPDNIMNPGQMGLDYAPFGGQPTDQFVKSPEDFVAQKEAGELGGEDA
jgi:FAD/FMN-containing dehydrogenase